MTTKEFVDGMMTHTAILAIKDIPLDQKRAAIEVRVRSALNFVADRYPFPFVCAETTYTGGSVSGQSDYIFDQKAAAVKSIIYGDDLRKLMPITQEDADALVSQFGEFTQTAYWIDIGKDGLAPKVRILKTPDTNGQEITYRYRKANMIIEQWPENYLHVVEAQIISSLVPGYTKEAEIAIDAMIGNFVGHHPINPVIGDPEVRERNRERNARFGYNGEWV